MANSYAEQVHATNYVKILGALGSTKDNLDAAAGGESFEIAEMYPAYAATAQLQGEKSAETYFNYALAAEKVHEGIYRTAREAVGSGRDVEFKPIHVCSVCGFTMEGDAPDKCPVCGAPKDKFVPF